MGKSKDSERLEAIRMHCVDGKSFVEIGKKLKVRGNTVSSWVKDFKKRLAFDEDLQNIENLIKDENSIPFLKRLEINKSIKRIKEKTRVINHKFFN